MRLKYKNTLIEAKFDYVSVKHNIKSNTGLGTIHFKGIVWESFWEIVAES